MTLTSRYFLRRLMELRSAERRAELDYEPIHLPFNGTLSEDEKRMALQGAFGTEPPIWEDF